MKITYDPIADAAYIYLTEESEEGMQVAKTYACDSSEVNGMINLDFDEHGKLIGVEVLDAKSKLDKDILSSSVIISKV